MHLKISDTKKSNYTNLLQFYKSFPHKNERIKKIKSLQFKNEIPLKMNRHEKIQNGEFAFDFM